MNDLCSVCMNPSSIEDYRRFVRIKALPTYQIKGRRAQFPPEYAERVGIHVTGVAPRDYAPADMLFDYQQAIVQMAIAKRRFAVFADCGLGKTLIFTEFARYVLGELSPRKCILIVSPLMVIGQTLSEIVRFYGKHYPPIEQLSASNLQEWLDDSTGTRSQIGITNYEALRSGVTRGRLGALIADESSLFKSAYGRYGQRCIELGKGLQYKLACTGTPAPNDRIEFANHAVFLDQFPTVNSFLARYFVNRGQTQERWILKPHAVGPFYRSLSHWCIFLANPATYGWRDNNTDVIPPIYVHKHHVELTPEQTDLVTEQTGSLFAYKIGGITNRLSLGLIAKGWHRGKDVPTLKYDFIKRLVEQWPDESTLIWCLYNREQKYLEDAFPKAASIKGETSHETRMEMIRNFQTGNTKVLISKPKILGFGLNLQVATRHVFSGLSDSYESYYQAIKRSNRIGSTLPLNVHIPMTDIEEPMITNVFRKVKRIQFDTEEQERSFRNASIEQ